MTRLSHYVLDRDAMGMLNPDFVKWDQRFLQLAKEVSSWSKDPSTMVGSVIVDDKRRPRSFGYNGFPRGIGDTDERLQNREMKYSLVVHAEVNAILNAGRDVEGCTLYVWPFMPCDRCAGIVIQAGIKRVVTVENNNPRWVEAFERSKAMLNEAKVFLYQYPDNPPVSL